MIPNVRIEISTGNAAFDPQEYEVARILRKYADEIEKQGLFATMLLDLNGNTVGSVVLEGI